MCRWIGVLCAITLLCWWTAAEDVESGVVDAAIASLYRAVLAQQFTDTVPFEFPNRFGHEAGRYANTMQYNYVGNTTQQRMRRDVAVPDNNMFVTQFVGEALLFSGLLAPASAPLNDSVLSLGLRSTLANRDKRYPENVPVFGFWPQKWAKCYDAGGLFGWLQWSMNLSEMMEDEERLTAVLRWLLKDVLHDVRDYDRYVQSMYWTALNFLQSMNIPPDADSFGTTMGFMYWAERWRSHVPQTAQLWEAQSFNVSTAYEQLVGAAYCPAAAQSSDRREDITSQSYFWARGFVQNITDPEDCVVATWVQTFPYTQAVYQGLFGGPVIDSNDLDACVQANSIYGMSASLLQGSDSWFRAEDGRGRRLYLKTAKLVAWALRTQPTQTRPDLEALYYPAIINFPYFVARHLRLLESADSLPFPEMVQVRDMLRDASYTGGYEYIAGEATTSCGLSVNATCWSGFLGQADTDDQGNPTPHYDDRFYTTAVAVNALIDFYTLVVGNGSSIAWKNASEVPAGAVEMIRGGCAYLLATYNDPNISLQNAFFSGREKSNTSAAINSPPTYLEDLADEARFVCANMTYSFWSNNVSAPYWVVRGVVSEAVYENLLRDGCGNMESHTKFHGYNSMDGWLFWSAPVLSQANAMMALAKARSLGIV